MKILVIIVTYNAMKWIDRCLESVKDSNVSTDVFIIDNGSNDGTIDYIKKLNSNIILYESQNNLGFGLANNIGLQYAYNKGYEYAYLLNQDAWVLPDTFQKLINAHQKQPEFGIISPMQLQANMEHLDVNFRSNIIRVYENNDYFEDLIFNRSSIIRQVKFAMAAHWLLPIETIKNVGLFSPAFPHYGEDANYVDRAMYHGYKIGIVTDALAVHDRESRVNSEEKRYYLDWYILTIYKISSLKERFSKINYYYSKNLLREVFLRGHFYPIKYTFKLLCNIKTILKYKEQSKEIGAFMKIQIK